MSRLRHRLEADDGLTLPEILVSVAISMILFTAAIVWFAAANNTERALNADTSELDTLRNAKANFTKEVRWAKEVYPGLATGPNEVVMYIDLDGSTGYAPDPGELITWRIESDGRLTRTDDLGNVEVRARGLESASTLTYSDTDKTVSLVFIVDLDDGNKTGERRIESKIRVRNA